MKTSLPVKQLKNLALLVVALFTLQASFAQALSFRSYQIEGSGTPLAKGTEYRFSNVATGVDALVKIEDLVGGAKVTEIDQSGTNADGSRIGYDDAFQPSVYTPGGNGTSYALFSFKFVVHGGNGSADIGQFSATSLDIDGNNKLKEFSEIAIPGNISLLSYLTQTLQIAVLPVANGFKGTNISGVEYGNIDTSALTAMYTVKRTTVNHFKLKFGAVTSTGAASTSRQYSLYMKDFSYTLAAPLPVKLMNFSASLVNNTKAALKWTTATEENLSHFIVERSIDGINYSDAGMVFANGNTTSQMNYAFNDNVASIASTIIYYRLRSVDVDGRSDYSAVRVIRLSKTTDAISILTYPNPATTDVRVTLPASWQNKTVAIELFYINGATAARSIVANSSQTETISLAHLNSGMYIVKVTCEGQTAQQKIVKQ